MRIVSSTVLLSLLSATVLSACAANPEVVEVSTGADATMSCTQLKQEILTAEQYEQSAREEDKFKFSYIAIFPAMFSVYNMHKAESAAKERKENLSNLYQQKNCAYAPQTPATPAAPAMPQGFVPPAMPGQQGDIYSNPFDPSQGGSAMPYPGAPAPGYGR